MKSATIKSAISSLAASMAGLVYDNRCPACDDRADSMGTFPLCRKCFGQIVGYTGPACKVCAKPFVSRYSDMCGDCLSIPPAFDRAYSFGLYEGVLMHVIHQMKFKGSRRLIPPMSERLLGLCITGDIDVIVPVPMTKIGLMARGYNQTALMARELDKRMGDAAPLLRLDMLYKVKETPPQVGLSRRARLNNLKGAFRASDNAGGLRVLVLDDVITTGTTMRECAKALKRAGASEVVAMSLARTY